jgi:hypothetical protein
MDSGMKFLFFLLYKKGEMKGGFKIAVSCEL